MPHHHPDRVARARGAASMALVALLGIVATGCVELTPPPATQPVASMPATSAPDLAPTPTPRPTDALVPSVAPASPLNPAVTVEPVSVTPVPAVTDGPVTIGDTGRVTPELAAKLQSIIDQWRKDAKVPGVVAAIRMPDGTIWTGATGRAIVGTGGEMATVNTPWVIGSITKTFVAALAFKLQEDGKLSLDDPISTWLPDYPNGSAITLRMLMNHTSGIADYFWNANYKTLVFDRPDHHWTVDEILAMAAEQAPIFRPGADQSYSNTGYILVGRILEIVGGEPLAKQLRDRFFDPLGLTSVVFQGDEEVPPGAAKGYWRDAGWVDWSDDSNIRPSTSAATVVWAAGAIVASVTDLLTWEDALYSGRILSPDSLAQLLTFGKAGYGPGTRYQKLAGWDGYGHGGSLRGFNAGMYRMPEVPVDVIVMTNRGDLTMDLTLLAADLVKASVGRKPGTLPAG